MKSQSKTYPWLISKVTVIKLCFILLLGWLIISFSRYVYWQGYGTTVDGYVNAKVQYIKDYSVKASQPHN